MRECFTFCLRFTSTLIQSPASYMFGVLFLQLMRVVRSASEFLRCLLSTEYAAFALPHLLSVEVRYKQPRPCRHTGATTYSSG